MSTIAELLDALPVFWAGVLASLVAGLATGLGALPVIVFRRISAQTQDILMGFSAGVMLAAAIFSLVIPAVDVASQDHGRLLAASLVGVALFLGAVGLWGLHQRIPHEHLIKGRDDASHAALKRVWMFLIAITIHNLPEGLAVGVGFGGGNIENGLSVGLAIFIQNLPEGFVTALAFRSLGYSSWPAIGLALSTGFVETFGGIVGAGTVSISAALLPWGLSVAGGAMIFVISHEIIPETHRRGYETPATFALMFGFALMMVLDVALK